MGVGQNGENFIMAEEETAPQTEDVTHDGTETAETPDTNDAPPEKAKETQAEIDRRISEGIKAYIAKREAEAEEKRKHEEQIAAIKDGKFEEALKMTQAKLDAIEAERDADKFKLESTDLLIEMGMAKFGPSLIPNAKSIDDLLRAAQLIKDEVSAGIEQGVNERLNTGPPRTPANTHKTPDKTPDTMTKEEYLEWKKERKLV